MNYKGEKRKLLKPAKPNYVNNGKGGSRPHYPAVTDTMIIKGVSTKLADIPTEPGAPPHSPTLDIYFKENKHGHPHLTRHEAVFSEFWVMMIGKEHTSKPYLVVDPEDHNKVIGLATDKINFKPFKHYPEFKRWSKFDKKDLGAILTMIERAQEDDTHADNIGIRGYDLCLMSDLNDQYGIPQATTAKANKIYLSQEGDYWISKENGEGEVHEGNFTALAAELGIDLNNIHHLLNDQAAVQGIRETLEADIDIDQKEKDQVLRNRLRFEDRLFKQALAANHAKYKLVKIDHDMSFYDAIYSRLGSGSRSYLHPFGSSRMHTDSREVSSFPRGDSHYMPHYWPGKSTPFYDKVIGKSPKSYTEADKQFITGLADDAEFNKEKFYIMLKFILIPQRLFYEMARQHLSEDSALLSLDVNAFVELQAEKIACTLASPEFRQALLANAVEYRQRFVSEITAYTKDTNIQLPQDMGSLFDQFRTKALSYDANDTSLHTAIRSEKFRFDESMKWYGGNLKTKNSAGKTPIELAVDLGIAVNINDPHAHHKIEHFKQVTQFLLERGAEKPANYDNLQKRRGPAHQMSLHDKIQDTMTHGVDNNHPHIDINTFTPKEYQQVLAESLRKRKYSKVNHALILNYQRQQSPEVIQNIPLKHHLMDALETALSDLSQDKQLTLKMKKNAAILAFKTVLPHLKTGDDFKRIEEILDKENNRFLRQLTSRFEIVRRIRGLYGVTSTYKTIAHSINKRMLQCEKEIGSEDPTDSRQIISEVRQVQAEKTHGFFARHMQLVHVKPLEKREVMANLAAPAA